MTPVVSVCIAHYLGPRLIDACIASVHAQDFDLPVEILVHDDASDDESVAHIRQHHPEVRLIESAQNVGFCVANNRMADAARGEYLLLLNNDAELLPDALRTLHAEASAISRPAILTLPQFDHASGDIVDRGCLLDPFFNPVPNLDTARRDVAMTIGACLWIPRTLWNELGGFPDWFGSIGEDLYLCCRARLSGHPVRVCDTSGYRHRIGASFGGARVDKGRLHTTLRRRAFSERNKLFSMIVIYPLPLLIPVGLLHAVFLLVEGVLLSLVKRDFAIWSSIYGPLPTSAWSARNDLLDERRTAQKSRAVTLGEFLKQVRIFPRKLEMLIRYGIPGFDRQN
ncbi:MAG: glycosyltransferase [Chromatiaceae bacterium]|nr:glycosyltransferase [Chromatiaceae bacterium]MCP5316155.1 glycosyltransferase [Chromatiaceae bacterium]